MKITLRTVQGFNTCLTDIPCEVFTFSGGEEQVKIDSDLSRLATRGQTITIECEIRSSSDFMRLAMIKDAVERLVDFNTEMVLVMLYTPYARQDRVCEPGEALSLKRFGDMLNSLEFDRVVVADPHSDVTGAVIDNLVVIPQEAIVEKMLKTYIHKNDFALVSPDAGALKKIHKVSKALGGVDVFCAEKIRDTKTGNILSTKIDVEDFKGRNLLIVDDICDNGGTFLALSKILKEKGAGRVDLYVTHGIFGKGTDLFSPNIDRVHCLNVWASNVVKDTFGLLVKNQEISRKELLKDVV